MASTVGTWGLIGSLLMFGLGSVAAADGSEAMDVSSMTDMERRSASIQVFNGASGTFAPLDREAQLDAYILAKEAIRLYPEQVDFETFSPDLAWMMLFRAYVAAELELSGEEDFVGRTVRGITLGEPEPIFAEAEQPRCGDFAWRKRTAIRNFGRAVLRNGGRVSMLVGLHLDETGKPYGINMISMTPEDNRHVRTVTERAMRTWRAEEGTFPEGGCMNHLVSITFEVTRGFRYNRW